MSLILKILAGLLAIVILKNIIYLIRIMRFDCSTCDYNWKRNENPNADLSRYCYMQKRKPRFCAFDTARYDKKLKRRGGWVRFLSRVKKDGKRKSKV
jgi:hypothetical protein